MQFKEKKPITPEETKAQCYWQCLNKNSFTWEDSVKSSHVSASHDFCSVYSSNDLSTSPGRCLPANWIWTVKRCVSMEGLGLSSGQICIKTLKQIYEKTTCSHGHNSRKTQWSEERANSAAACIFDARLCQPDLLITLLQTIWAIDRLVHR